MLYPTAPHLSQTQQHPRVGPLSCCFAMWQMNKPENIDFFTVFKYNFAVYSVCKCIWKKTEITFLLITMHAYPSLLVNNHNKIVMEDLTHIQVSQSTGHPWDSSIWSDLLVCVRHAFKVESSSGFCSCAIKKNRKESGRNNILTSPRLLY